MFMKVPNLHWIHLSHSSVWNSPRWKCLLITSWPSFQLDVL